MERWVYESWVALPEWMRLLLWLVFIGIGLVLVLPRRRP